MAPDDIILDLPISRPSDSCRNSVKLVAAIERYRGVIQTTKSIF